MRALAGFAVLFLLYQAPQGVQDYVHADRRLWLALTLLFFPVAHVVARFAGGRGIRDYGLTGRPVPGFPLGIAVGLAASAGAGVAAEALGLYKLNSVNAVSAVLVPALLLAFGSGLASLAEDILTRGFLWAFTPARSWSATAFAGVSAALFVANHIYVITKGPAMWAFLFALGFGLAYALHRTGSLWLTFGAHWGWNLAYHWTNLLLNTTATAPPGANTLVSAGAATILSFALVALSHTAYLSGPSEQIWNNNNPESTSAEPHRKASRRS